MDISTPGAPLLSVFCFVFTIRGTSEIYYAFFYIYFVSSSELEKLIKQVIIFYSR